MPRRHRIAFIRAAGTLALLASARAHAVDLAAHPFDERFWDRTDSLQALAQAPDGTLWIGSRTGLQRFDGDRFVAVPLGDEPRPSGTWVRQLLAARDGSVFIADGAGELAWETAPAPRLAARHGGAVPRLLRLWPHRPLGDPMRVHRFSRREGLPSDWVWVMAEDADGDVFIGTEAGLARVRDGALERVEVGPPGGAVSALVLAPDGALFAGTPSGVLTRARGAAAFRPTPITEPVRELAADRAGRIWALAHERLVRLDRDGRVTSFPMRAATALTVDADDNLWVGADGERVKVFAGGLPARLPWHSPSVDVNDLIGDREGSLWLAKRDGLLTQIASPPIRTVFPPSGQPAIFAVMRSRTRGMYVSAAVGLRRYLDGAWTVWPRGPDAGYGPRDLSEGPPGHDVAPVWYCDVHGLHRERGGEVVAVEPPGIPADLGCRNVVATRAGDLWVGWRGRGLHFFAGADTTRAGVELRADQGFCTRDLIGGLEAADGSLWFAESYDGSPPAGVTRIQRGRARCYGAADGLPAVHVGVVAEDREGTIWLGTAWGAGLVRFRDDRFTVIPASVGLPRANITGILDDGRGHLFIGSENGVWRVRKAELEACAGRACAGVDATVYGQEDGMRTPECTGAFQPNMAVDERGNVWVATLRGISVFSPDSGDPPARARPTPIIEEVAIDTVAVAPGREIRLAPGQRDLVIRYTAATFLGPRPRLAHRMRGFDADWLPATAPPVAHYHDLAPGRYRFEIRAGVAVARTLDVVVDPPFWRRPIFAVSAAALLGAAALVGFRLRLARRRTREAAAREERARIARDLHDGVAQKLAAMGLLADRVRLGDPDRPAPELHQLRHILGETHAELRRAIWDMRHEDAAGLHATQRLEPLIERVVAAQVLPPEIELRLNTDESSWPVGGLCAHEVPLVVKEALTNAVRHAQARSIEIGVISDEDGVNVWVRDDGRGMPELPTSGLGASCGVVGMYERARRIGGELTLRKLARGTEVRLSVTRARAGGGAGEPA